MNLSFPLQDQVSYASRAAEGQRPHRPIWLLLAVRAASPGSNLQQCPRLGVGGQGFGGQRGNLLMYLIIVDDPVHLHAQPGQACLELRERLILGYLVTGQQLCGATQHPPIRLRVG